MAIEHTEETHMMTRAKKIYLQAHERYDRAEAIIKEMSGERGEEFFRNAMKNFDIVLQCILYKAALTDKKYARAERKFLKDITDYEDVPALVKAKSFRFNAKGKEQFFAELDETADRASTALIVPFAKIDADNKERDFLAELEDNAREIFFGFSSVDGDDLERGGARDEVIMDELGTLASLFGTYFTAKWEIEVAAAEGRTL